MNGRNYEVDEIIAGKIPAKFAFSHKMIPLKVEEGRLLLAVTEPVDLHAIDDLRLLLECDIRTVPCSEKELLKVLKNVYGVGAVTMERLSVESVNGERLERETAAEDKNEEDVSLIKFVNQLIYEAYRDRATDIHLEPYEDDLIVRYRIDGILHDIPVPPAIKDFQSAIISRIKIMSDMNIAEKRLPQDGRIQFKVDDEVIDLRVSTLPIAHGESIDLRILPRNEGHLNLENLGLPAEYLKKIEGLIKKPHGILLVTGPTGHGKTTTLYACLSKINSPDKKIITVEDPIEYKIKRINQVPVNSKIGLSFATGLRSILRQDPDIIMVGEIRDQETAEIAIRSSLTGHLVFSTLHTNDAPGAVTRLIDMGIEPYLVSSSIEAIMAQRLVRLLCMNCRIPYRVDEEYLERNGFCLGGPGRESFSGKQFTIYRAGAGCEECRHSGYRGRTGIYELLIMDEKIRQLVMEKISSGFIRKEAIVRGMTTLRQDGWRKIEAGLTSVEEVVRVTQEEP